MWGGVQIRAPLTRPRSGKGRIRTMLEAVGITGGIALVLGILTSAFSPAGAAFREGEAKIRPGTYTRLFARPSTAAPPIEAGVVAAIFRSEWGPLGAPTKVTAEAQVTQRFGSGGTTDIPRQAFRGGAAEMVALRQGTGGAKAALGLLAAAAARVTLTAKYVGTRANGFTVSKRTSLEDATKEEIVLYEGGAILERIRYTPGADEAQAATDAINAESSYLDATYDGAGAIDDVTQVALAGGASAVVDGAALTAALGVLETESFNVLVADVEDAASHTTIAASVDTMRSGGLRVMAVIGEPIGVNFATRLANAQAINDEAIVYVANGFTADDVDLDGRDAAARVGGMLAAAPITGSLTHARVTGATDIVGALSSAEIEQAIEAGVLTFSKGATGAVQVEYGITTLTTLAPEQDEGWKKIRRTRTRDALITEIIKRTDALVGKVNNTPTGRALLIAEMQGAINQFVAIGALLGGTAYEDPANPASGDSAWFVIEFDDNDSAEKIYEAIGTRFAPPQAA